MSDDPKDTKTSKVNVKLPDTEVPVSRENYDFSNIGRMSVWQNAAPDPLDVELADLKARVKQLEDNQINLLRWIDMINFQAVLAGDGLDALRRSYTDTELIISLSRNLGEQMAEQITNLIENFDGEVRPFTSETPNAES